ncbi:uncharacterized protein LOC141628686 [Silene latifolia]|uniref:uncharacterized protein LOC141628686 n=1 Tax=Silene latifolia TaxID=37657 RepID=UPI003D774162
MTLLTDNIEHNGKRKTNEEEFCRDVEAKFIPYVGQEFLEIEEAMTFYRIYDVSCAFDVRKYTAKRWRGGEIKSKMLVCNQEGFKHKGQLECSGRQDSGRRHKVRRVGCKARIRLFMRNGELRIDRFHSGHNHELVSARDREFQKFACNITDYHKMIILYNSRVSIPDSFKWVFTHFLAAMGGKEPKYIITDHDPGILKAVPLVFKTAQHRYSRWTSKDTHKTVDNRNGHTFPVISTHLAIEVHGAQVYSHKVFEEFQEEAKCSIGNCKSRGFTECGSLEVTTVRDANRDINYEVTYCPDGKQIVMSVMWSEIHQTVGMLMGKLKNDVDNFSSLIRQFKEKISPLASPLNKQQQLEKILSCSPSQEITILPPKKSKNKGSGKRMLSMKEKAVTLARKPKRMCKNCKRLANYDKRNCHNPFAEHPPLSQL